MNISRFSIKRPVFTTMLIISMVVLGILALWNLKSELMPKFSIPVVSISTTWPGASPENMENLVTKKIEDSLSSVEGISKITTSSTNERSIIVAQFDFGVDVDKKANDIVTEVSRIRGQLPDDVSEPRVRKSGNNGDLVMMASISGDDLMKVKEFADDIVTPRLERIDGVGEVLIRGGVSSQVLVDLDPSKVASYGLTATEIHHAIKSASMNYPAGYINEGSKKFQVELSGEIDSLEQVKNIVLKNDGDQDLLLKDVANVSLSLKEKTSYGRTNGKDNVIVMVEKSDTGNMIDIAKAIRKEFSNMETMLPQGSKFNIVVDSSEDVKSSIDSVKTSAITGLILASIILFIFLKDVRATLVIALSIPVSVISTFVMFGGAHMTLNIISLMGLSLGVGMLVDNSVVVLDNIFRHLTEFKKSKMAAAADGASEMTVPIIASTATTVAVFLPIVLREGLAKEIFHDMSYAITFSLLASLVIALTFVPMICSRVLNDKKDLNSEGFILRAVKKLYEKILKVTLKFRIVTIIVTIVIAVGIIRYGTKHVGGGFFPSTDNGVYTVIATLPPGLEVEKADKAARFLESVVAKDKDTQMFSTSVSESHASVIVNVGKPGVRDKSIKLNDVVNRIRPLVMNKVPDATIKVVPRFSRGGGGNGGDLSLVLKSDDVTQMKSYMNEIQEKMEKIPGLVEISNSTLGGNPKAKLVIDRTKLEYYGINVSDLALAVSYQIRGVSPIKIKNGSKEINVTVQIQKDYRQSIDKLLDSRISTKKSGIVKLRDVVSLQTVEGSSGIDKEDKIAKVEVYANLGSGIDLVTAQKEVQGIINDLNMPSTITYSFGGDGKSRKDVTSQLGFAFLIAIFLIYFILASQFESFILPLIVMGTVPLSVMGVYVGLLITGQKTDVMVFVGIIMLAGIVVNNAIVLIDYMNILKVKLGYKKIPKEVELELMKLQKDDEKEHLTKAEKKEQRKEARKTVNEIIVESGKTRMRPIFMTTLTTVFGMIPLALGIGQGSEMYKGMAIAVIFGLSFSTILTLVFIPTLYSIYSSVENRVMQRKK